MVFSGKPSTACLACRQRRLRCDRVPAGCSQCKRKGITCSGYRDPSALRMRDETTRLKCKFAKPQHPVDLIQDTKISITVPEKKLDPVSRFVQSITPSQEVPTYSLRQNLRDVSMAYFLTSYIYATPFQGYVPSFCLDDSDDEDACSITISATALAAYSRRVRSAKYLESARQQYAMALTQVNKLLSRRETAVLDTTLVSVLVLGLFEAIVFEGGKSPTNWTAHTFGSLELLRLRGPHQCETPVSRRMFAHASNNIKTSCIQRSIPVPEDFVAFDRYITVFEDANSPTIKLSPMIDQIASIKARSMASPDCHLVYEALKLDAEFIAMCESCPGWMAYKVEPNSESPIWAYERVCHRYPDARVAKLWNAIRLLRFFLITFVKDVAKGVIDVDMSLVSLSEHETGLSREDFVSELLQYATENMRIVTTDVLASIPSFMETDDFGRRFAPSGRSLAWPLGIIESTALCGEAARNYAYKHLSMLAGDLNLPQAVHPSRFPGDTEDWMHLFHLG